MCWNSGYDQMSIVSGRELVSMIPRWTVRKIYFCYDQEELSRRVRYMQST